MFFYKYLCLSLAEPVAGVTVINSILIGKRLRWKFFSRRGNVGRLDVDDITDDDKKELEKRLG